MRCFFFSAIFLAGLGATACDEVPDTTGGGGQGGGSGGGDPFADSATLDVPTDAGRAYVDLDTVALVGESDEWDLAIEGRDVFTNGGVSGPGNGGAFPSEIESFREDSVPADIPFLVEDASGGPFLRWYAYDGGSHLVYSRFHVYGVRRGEELYKVQILSFYGEVDGAPVPAIYQIRSARIDAGGDGETVLHQDIDATAGGADPPPSEPSGCLRLSTGAQMLLTPAEALESTAWDLCIRRDVVSLNGGTSGAAGVEAVDLQASETAGETLSEVMERTEASELPAFDAADEGALTDSSLSYRTDGVVTAFTDKWIVPGSNPYAPAELAWLVAGSDGETPFWVGFEAFDGATADAVGTVKLRVKSIGGTLP